jgi:hypothetical protein
VKGRLQDIANKRGVAVSSIPSVTTWLMRLNLMKVDCKD